MARATLFRCRSHRRLIGTALAVALGWTPADGSAQQGCEFVFPSGDLQMITLAGNARITYVGSPHMLCDDDVEIWADSAVSYSAQGMDHLIGSVRFLDQAGELNADEARYFSEQGRLQASGNLFVQDTLQGYTIENGDLVYLRGTDFRDQPQITVTTGTDGVRPKTILHMKAADPAPDTVSPLAGAVPAGAPAGAVLDFEPPPGYAAVPREGAQPAPPPVVEVPVPGDPSEPAITSPDATADSVGAPYEVVADRIFIQGNTYFRATGTVEIERDSLRAFADSAEYDQVAGRLHLEGSARVEGATYDLVGRTINLGLDGNDISEVVARRDAILTGDDLRLRAPEIRVYMAAGLLERLIAVRGAPDAAAPSGAPTPAVGEGPAPPTRPVAFAEAFELTGDSLEVIAPGEALEQIFAAGAARSVSAARDSLNVELLPEIARSDWLEGDTIIVTFVPNRPAPSEGGETAADTSSSEYRIDRIVAKVGARSLYRLVPSDTTAIVGVDAPAVHYVTGEEITISMVDGEVRDMDVKGQTRGIHLEPLRSSTADSLSPDSVVVDTTRAGGAPSPDSPSMARHRAPAGDAPTPRRSRPHGADPAATHDPWRRT